MMLYYVVVVMQLNSLCTYKHSTNYFIPYTASISMMIDILEIKVVVTLYIDKTIPYENSLSQNFMSRNGIIRLGARISTYEHKWSVQNRSNRY